MKKNLLFAFFFIAVLTSACSKGSDNDESLPNTYWGQKVDSVIKKTGIKVLDPNNLNVNDYFYKDKEESIYLFGNRGVKFWMGVYSKTGVQLLDKTFEEDPETVYAGFNNTLKLTNTSIRAFKEIGNSVYLVRGIYPEYAGDAAVEVITKYNIPQKMQTTTYSELTSKSFATHRILPWFNNTILFVTSNNSEGLLILKDDKENILEKFSIPSGKSTYMPTLEDIPTSKSDFVRTGTIVSKLSVLGTTEWTLNLIPELTSEVRVTIKSKNLTSNILTIAFEIMTFEGQKSEKTYKVDINTGKQI